jgi:hypothetical protein
MRDPVREGKSLYSAGRLHGVWPAKEVLARVEALDAWRKSQPARRKRMWLLLLGGFAAAIVFTILRAVFPHSGAFGALCSLAQLAGVIAVVVSIVMLIQLYRLKCDEDAAVVLGPLVRCIGPDLAKGGLLKVNASLSPPTGPDLLVRTGEKYSTARYPDCIDRFFKREILNLECRLRDGTRLQAGIVEHTVEKVHKKKNPRGKWKTKTKCRRKIGIRARLVLDDSRCRLTGAPRLPAGTAVRVRRHPRGAMIFLSLNKYVADTQRMDAGPLLALLAGVYGAITPVQKNEPIPTGGTQ